MVMESRIEVVMRSIENFEVNPNEQSGQTKDKYIIINIESW
jgi:hypothetical protein